MADKRLGILGGTFNPIHNGHLALARAALKKFKLDEVIFIPTGTPPHKEKDKDKVEDKEMRYEMVRLAIGKNRKFLISRIEIDRPGKSFAVDTFKALMKKFGPRAKLYYLMGLDSLNEIVTWKKPFELFKLCELIVAARPGVKRNVDPRVKAGAVIHWLALKKNVSGSAIRARLMANRTAARLLPKAVAEYIKRNRLYADS